MPICRAAGLISSVAVGRGARRLQAREQVLAAAAAGDQRRHAAAAERSSRYVELTGNTVAFATVDLVARVEGFLTSINYKDGAFVKKGDLLFLIEPTTYEAKVKQAEAELDSAKAQLVQAQAEFIRQETLLRQNVSAQNTYDQAKAKRDSAQANVENNAGQPRHRPDQPRLHQGRGAVRRHRHQATWSRSANWSATASRPSSRPSSSSTRSTSNFNMSEQDVLNIRAKLSAAGLDLEELSKIPLDIGLMTEEGYPAQGPSSTTSRRRTRSDDRHDPGARPVRQSQSRPAAGLLRPHPRADGPQPPRPRCSCPTASSPRTRPASTLLVVNKDDVVEQRRITTGSCCSAACG